MGDFHFLINGTAREGTYQVRLYSVPLTIGGTTPFPVMMASANPLLKQDHWSYIAQTKPTVLEASILQTIAPLQVESESELEQGNPRYASMQLDLIADPALQIVVEAMRDSTKNIWCEITLFQNINDAPARPPESWQTINHTRVLVDGASLVWPTKEKLFFWGFVDRKSGKGKVHSQWLQNRIQFVRYEGAHSGVFSFVFLPWIAWSNFQHVKSVLDWITGQSHTNPAISAGQMAAALMSALAPTPFLLVADQQQKSAIQYQQGFTPDIATFDPNQTTWGKMSIRILSADNTPTEMMPEVFIDAGQMSGGHALWIYDATKQTHALTSDQDSTSLYHWNDLAQALTEWCREFFFTWQCELPTLQQASISAQSGGVDTSGYARFLLLDIATTPSTGKPLSIAVDAVEDTIEYSPCGAWATSYTVSEPSADDLLPQPPEAVATSEFVGGSDESYTTLLRFCGYSTGNPQDARGWEIYVKDSHGDLAFAVLGVDLSSNSGSTQWPPIHAMKKISRWGMPRAIVTLTSKGVGIEPWGQSASINGKPITAPQLTYGLLDFSDFPLGRQVLGLPGILASPGDESSKKLNAIGFEVISIKRTPNGDTELKLIEVAGAGGTFSPQPPMTVLSPVPPNPPLPPGKGGPPDSGPISITGV